MNVANFPYQGPIENPTLDDYLTELSLIEATARDASQHHDNRLWGIWRRWKRTIRMLSWAQMSRPRDA
jgi:hypothetical protein